MRRSRTAGALVSVRRWGYPPRSGQRCASVGLTYDVAVAHSHTHGAPHGQGRHLAIQRRRDTEVQGGCSRAVTVNLAALQSSRGSTRPSGSLRVPVSASSRTGLWWLSGLRSRGPLHVDPGEVRRHDGGADVDWVVLGVGLEHHRTGQRPSGQGAGTVPVVGGPFAGDVRERHHTQVGNAAPASGLGVRGDDDVFITCVHLAADEGFAVAPDVRRWGGAEDRDLEQITDTRGQVELAPDADDRQWQRKNSLVVPSGRTLK